MPVDLLKQLDDQASSLESLEKENLGLKTKVFHLERGLKKAASILNIEDVESLIDDPEKAASVIEKSQSDSCQVSQGYSISFIPGRVEDPALTHEQRSLIRVI